MKLQPQGWEVVAGREPERTLWGTGNSVLLIWVLVTQMSLVCENSMSRTFTIHELFCTYIISILQ